MKAFEDVRKVSDLSDGEFSAGPKWLVRAVRPRDPSEIYFPDATESNLDVIYLIRVGDVICAKLSNGAIVSVTGAGAWLIQ